jgi:two-component system, LytTR family, response regulator
MKSMTVAIIEDELKSLEMLRKMLELFCRDVNVAGVARSVTEGVELIKNTKPDIVLLDIELKSQKGFEVLTSLESIDFEVIFTTAYKDYAIDAIRHNALEYLLKPIDINELKNAIDKATRRRSEKTENVSLKKLLTDLRSAGNPRISIYTNEGIMFTDVKDIIRCEAKGPYTNIYTTNCKKYTTSKTLKEYERTLSEYNFLRIHNSHLINIAEVAKFIRTNGGSVEMNDGSIIPVSQNHKEEFFEKMKVLI